MWCGVLYPSAVRGAASSFAPSVVVLQCGADALTGDPLGEFNLSSKCYTDCLEEVRRCMPDSPVLLLGGGGYSQYNVARCWTGLTYAAVHKELPPDVPDHEFVEEYLPSCSFHIRASYRRFFLFCTSLHYCTPPRSRCNCGCLQTGEAEVYGAAVMVCTRGAIVRCYSVAESLRIVQRVCG